MRFSLSLLMLATPPFAPADSARAGGTSQTVAEIVSFQLIAGRDEAQFLTDAQATDPIVRAAPGFISRKLSKGADGIWTDYILWQSMSDAMSAAKTVVNEPAFAPFGSAIDLESLAMRHETVLWQMQH